jgi:hypothetical protein
MIVNCYSSLKVNICSSLFPQNEQNLSSEHKQHKIFFVFKWNILHYVSLELPSQSNIGGFEYLFKLRVLTPRRVCATSLIY